MKVSKKKAGWMISFVIQYCDCHVWTFEVQECLSRQQRL